MAASSWAWPVVGLAVGAISSVAGYFALAVGVTPPMAAIVALAAGALATGALHEDGLADLADGFGGGRTRDRKLEIMRDSRIGSYGVVALVLCFAFRAAGLAALIDSGGAFLGLLSLAAASRAVLPAALILMPPARQDGLGRAAAGIEPVPARIAGVIGLLCLLPLGPGTAAAIAVAMALAASPSAGSPCGRSAGRPGTSSVPCSRSPNAQVGLAWLLLFDQILELRHRRERIQQIEPASNLIKNRG